MAADRIGQIRREHDEKVRQLKADGDRALREERQRHERSLQEHDERIACHRKEFEQTKRNEDALILARRRNLRAYKRHAGLPLTTQDRLDWLREQNESLMLSAADPKVHRLWMDFTAICARENIYVSTARAPEVNNGTAYRSLREVYVPPFQSLETAACGWHEAGHVIADLDPTAVAVKTESGRKIVVSNELAAWRWVLEHIPVWTLSMHQVIRESLDTYRPYATADEQRQMDVLCSQMTLADTRLRIAKMEMEPYE
jgi:hypothetical protein